MAKKFTDKEKVERAKAAILRGLEEIRNNSNKAETVGFLTGQLAHTYALLDADKLDEMGIVYVAVQIMDEISPREKKPVLQPLPGQLELTGMEVKEVKK